MIVASPSLLISMLGIVVLARSSKNAFEKNLIVDENNVSTRIITRYPSLRSLSTVEPVETKVFLGVGGHASKNKGPAMLQIEGYILKPFQDTFESCDEDNNDSKKKLRGEMEAEFYAKVWTSNHPLKNHQPKFYGTTEKLDDGTQYIVLEDLTYMFQHACVLDLKMGRMSYDEDASPEKVAKERAKYPPQETVGFRFSGMRVYYPKSGKWVRSKREWCLSRQPAQILDALEQFFFDGESVRRSLIRSVVEQVRAIAKCLEDHPNWRMYGASLLIVYDAASTEDTVKARLIDFPHCYEIKDEGGKDYGFLHGLYFLLSSLNGILDRGRRNRTRRNSLVESSNQLLGESFHSVSNSTKALISENDIVEETAEVVQALPKISRSFEHLPDSSPTLHRRSTSQNGSDLSPAQLNGSDSPIKHTSRGMGETLDALAGFIAPYGTFSTISKEQVGGAHGNIIVSGRTIEKEEVDKEHFDNEVNFYNSIRNDTFSKVTPALVRVDESRQPRRLILENIMALVANPNHAALDANDPAFEFVNIMDVKIGFRSFRDDASNKPEGRYYEKYMEFLKNLSSTKVRAVWNQLLENEEGPKSLQNRKLGKRDYLAFRDGTTTSAQYGFRLTALRHFDFDVSQDEAKSKVDSCEDFASIFDRFLSSGPNGYDTELAAGFIEEIDMIIEAIDASEVFKQHDFVGTSLLFVHQKGVPVVRWIDFANVSSPASKDHNGIMQGIKRMRQLLEKSIIKHQLDI